MFTIKLYTDSGRCRIMAAESFTILRGDDGSAEITLHQKNGSEDSRVDVNDYGKPATPGYPRVYTRAIIENAAGKTTEIIDMRPRFNEPPRTSDHSEPKAA